MVLSTSRSSTTFLLFNSKKREYQELHESVIRYVRFLRDKSANPNLGNSLIRSWYLFPEVKQKSNNLLQRERVGESKAYTQESKND